MNFSDIFYELNFKKITKEEFSNILLDYYKDKNIEFSDIRDDLNGYVEEDLHHTLPEIEEELLIDTVWSIAVIVGNEDEGYEDCYLYFYYNVNENETITITNVELI